MALEAPELKRTLVTLASLSDYIPSQLVYVQQFTKQSEIFAAHHDLSNPESTGMRGVATIPEQSSARGVVRQNACLQSSKEKYKMIRCRQTLDHIEI